MASFIRLGAIRPIKQHFIKSLSTKSARSSLVCSLTRCINTSSKPPQANATTTASTTVSPVTTEKYTEIQDDKSENWISWGFNEDDQWWDRFITHSTMFTSVSLCLVFCATLIAYMPDLRENEWISREAYLRLRYREDNGLPLVDPDLIERSKLTLPTDEELGDTEIII